MSSKTVTRWHVPDNSLITGRKFEVVHASDYDQLKHERDVMLEELIGLRQHKKWAEPQIVQHGKDREEIERLRASCDELYAKALAAAFLIPDDKTCGELQALRDKAKRLLAVEAGPGNPTQLLIDSHTKPLHVEIERLTQINAGLHAAVDVLGLRLRAAGETPTDSIQAVINEMIAVAASEDDGDWTAEERAEIDKWQSRLQGAIGTVETTCVSCRGVNPESCLVCTPVAPALEAAIAEKTAEALAKAYPEVVSDFDKRFPKTSCAHPRVERIDTCLSQTCPDCGQAV